MKNTIIKYTALVGLTLASFSCSEDFLDKTPQSEITMDNFFQNKDQVYGATGTLYANPWFMYHYNGAHLIEAMAGNTTHWNNTSTLYNKFLINNNDSENTLMWGAFYRVIAFANNILVNMPSRVSPNVSKVDVNQALAEARFIRAAAYFYLVRLWGAVPIIENSQDLIAGDMNLSRNTVESVYEFILKDLKYAEEFGRPTRDLTGRVSKWSAKAMMAKVYLQMKDYTNSKIKSSEVIASGEYALNADFFDNFRALKDNSVESIFALQWISVPDKWTTQNTSQAWCAPGGITDVGDGWSAYLPTMDLKTRFETGDKRKKATIMSNGDFYPELISNNYKTGYTYNATKENSPTDVHWRKLVVGAPPQNGGQDGPVYQMYTGQNTNVIRYADVLLMNAEATIGAGTSTTDAKALANFNAVRKRAGLTEKTVITMDDIFAERRVELAGEYDFWYDLQRMDRTKAITYITGQDRGTKFQAFKVPSADIKWNLPIPAGEIDRAPKLASEPVPYVFKN